MNILVIAPTPFFSDRGCHIRILEELEALYTKNHTATLFTYHLGRNVGPAKIYRGRHIPWYTKTSAGPSWHKLYLDVLLFFTILKQARKQKFDIIHAHLHEGAWIGWWIKLFIRKPLILDAQGSMVSEMQHYGYLKFPGLKKIFQFIERWIVKHADHVFVSSPLLLEIMQNYTAHTSLLGDAINLKLFQNVKPLQLELKPHVPVIIYTGSLSKIKGFDYLLEAMTQINAQLLVVGYPNVEYYKTKAQTLGVAGKIKFVGQVNYFDLPSYLALANIAVDPKLDTATESSGKILNYMAAGLPVVAFDTINVQENFGMTGGITVTQENTFEGLAKAITTLLADKDKQAQLGKTGKIHVEEYFNWNTKIQHAIDIYEQLANK